MILPTKYNLLNGRQRRLVREEYISRQGGRCSYCGELLNSDPREDIKNKSIDKRLFPTGMFDHAIHLHHDHTSGMTKGAVHSHCNAVLWQYEGE